MRFEGRLAQWNDGRGFGFIEPTQDGERVFVHVSAFAPADRSADCRPRIGDRLSFEVAQDGQGRKQARHVVDASGGFGRWVGVLLLVAAVGWKGTQWWAAHGWRQSPASTPLFSENDPAAVPVPAGAFRCDGRTLCSQMTSCAEATFFLRNCPNTRMDGNRDGVPCEQQWCTSAWAK